VTDDPLDHLVTPERAAELRAQWTRDAIRNRMSLVLQLCADTRSLEATTCAGCDGPIHVGDRSVTSYQRPWHRSCVQMTMAQLAEFKRRKRHAHKPAAEPVDPRQATLFGKDEP
jgi:hypothetical protein